eukprot:3166918-Lingulodinium_polyedra.AAC.1
MHPKLKHLFNDVQDLIDVGVMAWDYKGCCHTSLPNVLMDVAGFPCTDVSSKNPLSNQRRG